MQTQRSLIWTGVDALSTEYLTLTRLDERWRIEGHVITAFNDLPAFISYSLLCNDQWHTRYVHATCHHGDSERSTTLHRDGAGWTIDGERIADLAECIDIDLEITPFTNTLPINRLNLQAGESAEVVAAWLRFPALTVEPLHQRYTRLAPDRYRYESGESFRAELLVDEDGLVLEYENGWSRPLH